MFKKLFNAYKDMFLAIIERYSQYDNLSTSRVINDQINLMFGR